ncbi:hypothetical protein GUITHDRAFT_144756 [Guillardia theta CCMP2712]|uniref:F-box domain-containing protein n=1 Tax=Guillardia theta (strain CCMP2712) TaxID=905079 RepID=L1IPR1_GUITC|nr:hypothetical protein GUITHDRAFT_144756 [Guillardia theta CCMP2712]EKX37790.1 hypothetical protein GUITHDRAFT_144756 [Guillardia theta CCMP2712]|eukprot:XP_005824770.1 hypothetical protein GUITHDRAFT_144756 [Guillardia theta CCMP2712]
MEDDEDLPLHLPSPMAKKTKSKVKRRDDAPDRTNLMPREREMQHSAADFSLFRLLPSDIVQKHIYSLVPELVCKHIRVSRSFLQMLPETSRIDINISDERVAPITCNSLLRFMSKQDQEIRVCIQERLFCPVIVEAFSKAKARIVQISVSFCFTDLERTRPRYKPNEFDPMGWTQEEEEEEEEEPEEWRNKKWALSASCENMAKLLLAAPGLQVCDFHGIDAPALSKIFAHIFESKKQMKWKAEFASKPKCFSRLRYLSLEGWRAETPILSQLASCLILDSLIRLDLSNCGLTDQDISALFGEWDRANLSGNILLEELYLDDNHITSDGIDSIAKFLGFVDHDVIERKKLNRFVNLRVLDLSSNSVVSGRSNKFSYILHNCKNLRVLNLKQRRTLMFDHALLARDLETLNQLDCFNEVTPWGKWRRPSLQQEYTSRFCSMTYMEDKKMQVKDGKRMSRTVLDTDQPPPPHVLDLHPWPLCFSIAELKFLSQSLPRVRPSLQELRFTSPVQDPGYISEILPALEELIRECKELKAVFLDDVEVFNSEREDEDSSILFHRHFDPGLEIHDKWPPPIFKRKMEKAHLITTIDVGQNARRHYICPVEFQDGLSSMPKLQSLILADTKLQARGCMVVVRAAAEHCRALQQLDLSKNGITVKGNDQQWWTEGKRTRDLDSLGGCLGMWKEMRLLSFSKNSLGPLPCRAIFQAIQTWEGDVELRLEDVSIVMLHLERNDLCNGRLRALLENVLRPLNKRISLHSLSLQHTKLGNEELAVLAHHILDEHQLSSSAHLPLNDPSCASPQCHRGFLELRELDLRLQMSGAQGQVKLAKALRSLQHLTTLDGISTEIMISKQQQEGVEEKLEKEGKGNRNRKVGVERLNFLHTDKLPHGHYQVYSSSTNSPYSTPLFQMDFIFMRMRRVHTIIGRLCIRNQDMGKKLSEELAELLPGMNHLRQLDLGFNQLKREGISKIARGLKEVMSGLESLNLEGNAIGPDGAKELVNLWSLKLHRRLKHLNMSSNRLDLEVKH